MARLTKSKLAAVGAIALSAWVGWSAGLAITGRFGWQASLFGLAGRSASSSTSTTGVTVGQTLTALQPPVDLATVPSQAPAQPTGWGARVNMKGCGAKASVRVKAGAGILLVNAGTLPRTLHDGDLDVFNPVAPADWREITFGQPGTYRVTASTSACTWTVANTVIVTVS